MKAMKQTKNINQKKSTFWSVALPLAVLFVGAAYYVKMPSVRENVDARTPIVRQLLGRFVQKPVIVEVPAKSAASTPAAKAESAPKTTPVPIVQAAPPTPAPAPLTLQQIASDRSLWPKKVALKKAATFPAVVNGKVVGSLTAPVGSEATVQAIQGDKVGLEFKGGGAWLPVEQTDLLSRVPARH